MRLQLALNVSDLDASVRFYSQMFAVEPAKRREGYANFVIDEPPLKLVLFQGSDAGESINHLGVEVESGAQVLAADARLSSSGLDTSGVADTGCCYAEKTETWVTSPDGTGWEWYVKRADSDTFDAEPGSAPHVADGNDVCCGTAASSPPNGERIVEPALSTCCAVPESVTIGRPQA